MASSQSDHDTRSLARTGRSRADVAVAERLLAAARTGADVRARKVRRLRAAIKVKVYENDLKLAVALEKMLDAVGEVASEARPVEPGRQDNAKHGIRSRLDTPKKN